MSVFFELNTLPEFRNAVVTIGSFDGVHSGHQEILRRVNRLARQCKGESIVVTFHPHPREVIYPQDDRPLRLITTIQERIRLFERYGIDNVVVIPFTVEFSQQSADEYIQKFLINAFHPRYIVIGYDHRFGINRWGDIHYLRAHAAAGGFEVVEIEQQTVDALAVSSSKIRNAVEQGNMPAACKLLRHFFPLSGEVVRGQNIGSNLGFPTANLDTGAKNKLIPPDGIYAVFAHHQGIRYGGMLYIGTRPTLTEFHNRTIEVHLFDFKKTIYGHQIQLDLVDRIRDDAAFKSLDELRSQLEKDRISAQEILRPYGWSEVLVKNQTEWPETAIVILNYNGRHHLEHFLPNVAGSGYPNMRIIVADNGSSDGSIAFLNSHYPDVACVDLAINHGFAEGYNEALRNVHSKYVVLLNSDVAPEQGWLQPIIQMMEENPNIAVVQPKIRSYENRHRFEYAGACGGWIDALGYPFCRGRIFAETEEDQGQYDEEADIFWASGAAFVIRKDTFAQFGGFDGDYFAHSEEIDLCWRLKRAGYRIVAYPQSVVYHLGGGTLAYNSPRKTYLNFRNSLFTLAKNESIPRLLALIPLRLILDGLAALLFLFQGKWRHILSIIHAHFSLYGSWTKLMRKRHLIHDLVEQLRIRPGADMSGRYRGSIVWQYYARNIHRFRDLTGLFEKKIR
jgi:riboflavin kinase/FMN adenylyltransferase